MRVLPHRQTGERGSLANLATMLATMAIVPVSWRAPPLELPPGALSSDREGTRLGAAMGASAAGRRVEVFRIPTVKIPN
eukprot:COSAG02_NODE_1097_length_14589_cov_6.159075_6_plen_79_part_00